jgi:hypothetical protein
VDRPYAIVTAAAGSAVGAASVNACLGIGTALVHKSSPWKPFKKGLLIKRSASFAFNLCCGEWVKARLFGPC